MLYKMFLFLILSVFCASAEKFRFDNYTVYKVYPENVYQVKLLQNLQNNELKYDFWSDPVPSAEFVQIMSAPSDKIELEKFLNDNGIRSEINMPNVQELIDKQTVKPYTRSSRTMGWDAYYKLDDIYAWLDDLITAYPNIVTEIIGGTTHEGRPIKGIKISHGAGKRAIFLEGGIHSREWISPATVNYIANELLTSTNSETVKYAQEFDWYIFPVTNPDGYVWCHESFRMWRKNRRPFGENFGVDLNRNWNANWLVAGANSDPATDIYAGPGPFSEPETRSLSEYIRSIADQIDLYLSFHSFSELLLLPFGNSTEAYGNYHDAMTIGRRAMGALSVRYGTLYTTGNIAEAIYLATGGSIDWVKGHLNIPLVYCYELRDKGRFGFLLPTDQILPNNEETMDSLLEIIYQAKRFGYMNAAVTGTPAFVLLVAAMLSLFAL